MQGERIKIYTILVRCDAFLLALMSAISTHTKHSHMSIINGLFFGSKTAARNTLTRDMFNICDIKNRCFQQNK